MESLPIASIQRNKSIFNVLDGACDELINVRYEDGEWVTMYNKSSKYNLSSISNIDTYTNWYHHPGTNDSWFIAYRPTLKSIRLIKANDSTSTMLLTLTDNESIKKISHYGVILIIVTDLNVYYLKYDKEDNNYELLPEIIHPSYTFCSDNNSIKTIENIYSGGSEGWSKSIAYVRNTIESWNKKGYFNGHAIFQVALKMHTGDYIAYSAPFYYYIGQHNVETDSPNISFYKDGTTTSGSGTYKCWYGYLCNVRFMFKDSYNFKQLLQKYDGFIKSICVFMGKSSSSINSIVSADIGACMYDSVEEIYSGTSEYGLEDNITMRLIHEIGVEEISSSSEHSEVLEPDYTEFESLEDLPINNFTNHYIYSDVIYEYNSHLHICAPTTIFAKGNNMPLPNFILIEHEKAQMFGLVYDETTVTYPEYSEQSVDDKLAEVIYIKTTDGYNQTMAIRSDVPVWKNSLGHDILVMNGLLSYPDTRANGLRLYFYDNDNELFYLSTNRELKPSTYRNLAFSEEKTRVSGTASTINLYPLQQVAFNDKTGYGFAGESTITSYNNRFYESNRIQVSSLYNFLHYPAEFSYRIGEVTNSILGVATQSTPMSDGQYGQFPLMIFTSNGIYTLEQGSGNVLYSSVQFASKEICNNKSCIAQVSGGILFSTENGVMVISGRQVQDISKSVCGDPDLFLNDDIEYSETISGQNNVITLNEAISLIDFKEYLLDAIITFNYNRKEIILSNTLIVSNKRQYKYSYIYSTESGTWTKSDQYYTSFIERYPSPYAFDGSQIFDLGTDYVADIGMLVKTRPFKLNHLNLKSIKRILARFEGECKDGSARQLAFYLYGSLNGFEWKIISGKRLNASTASQREIMLRMPRTTARYFIVVLAVEANEVVIGDFELSKLRKDHGKLE